VSETSASDGFALDAKARLPNHVVYRSFIKETVMLNLQTGKYHGLNPTAGRMLEVLEKSATVGDAVGTLAEEYGQTTDTITDDLRSFCVDLLDRGLIELQAAST
jgi:hypothetical protein